MALRKPVVFVAQLLLGLVLAGAMPCTAATLHVPSEYPRISNGLFSAFPGDTVLVECGVYYETHLVIGSDVTLRSETGSFDCVTIDAEYPGRAIIKCQDNALPARIEGFTITGGGGECYGDSPGGALLIENAGIEISDCKFYRNYACARGGGIYGVNADVSLSRCEFVENLPIWISSETGNHGGGIYLNSGTLVIDDCLFAKHGAGFDGAGGAVYMRDVALDVSESRFIENSSIVGSGGAIFSAGSSVASIRNCQFIENVGSALILTGICPCTIDGSTFVENTKDHDRRDVGAYAASTLYLTHSTFVSLGESSPGELVKTGSSTSVVAEALVAFLSQGDVVFECLGIGSLEVSCSNFYLPDGNAWVDCYADQLGINDNISVDPQFCGVLGSGNYYLQSDSPCAPANSPCGELIGAWAVGCGATSTGVTTWGAIKTLY